MVAAARIAHFSDLHIGSQLTLDQFERMVGAVRDEGVDHLILTGDMCNRDLITQEADARAVRTILMDYGYQTARQATVIPGNHDLDGLTGIFTGGADTSRRNLKLFFHLFGRFLRSRSRAPRFPVVKDVGGVTLFCFNSVVRLRDRFNLRYVLCGQQLRSLVKAIRHRQQQMKLLVVHHYPYRIRLKNLGHFTLHEWFEDAMWLPLSGWRRLVKACVQHGVDYILHGHSHSSRTAGFKDCGLVALGQGTTGEQKEFSIYELQRGHSGNRIRCTLDVESGQVRRLCHDIEPEFIVPDWAS